MKKMPSPILIAPNKQIKALWEKQYPAVKILLQKKLPIRGENPNA